MAEEAKISLQKPEIISSNVVLNNQQENSSQKVIPNSLFPYSLSATDIVELKQALDILNQYFNLISPVTIIFNVEDGPLFDPDTQTIEIPPDFIESVRRRFTVDDYQEAGVTPELATAYALIHTLFHEFAHALIDQYQLPVLGREEDAADSLAALILLHQYPSGTRRLLAAADLFDLESLDSDSFDEDDFSGVHSLDEQRYYFALCMAFAFDPKKNNELLNGVSDPAYQADSCHQVYDQAKFAWQVLLNPYLKDSQIFF